MSALPPKADICGLRSEMADRQRFRRRPACACVSRQKGTKNPARKTLFCLQSNAIIFGLRVHPRVNQILEGARDFLNAIQLIDTRRVQIHSNRIVCSHFKYSPESLLLDSSGLDSYAARPVTLA
jgi:hypothetical protein